MNTSSLHREAEACGIQTSYLDNTGKKQFASEETLRVLIDKLGSDPGTRPPVEPVIVAWQKSRTRVAVPASSRLFLQNADGTERLLKPDRSGSAELPPLESGYHTLIVEKKGDRHESLVISAPRKVYADPARQWGGFLPMYAARSERSWGAGNLGDWRELAAWLASRGARVIGTLPLLAAFLDKPVCEPSPYSPASRLFWNEFFIDVEAVPEFQAFAAARKIAGSARFQRALRKFRASDLIDYRAQWGVRREILEILAREFFRAASPRQKAFREYLQERPDLERYARFRAACDLSGGSWQTWKSTAKNGRLSKADYNDETRRFYLYIQWLAQEQMDSVLRDCRERQIQFYLDLPLGVNPDGFDAWRFRGFFAQDASAGAPPDSFFTKGQDWGFAPLCPRRARELKYRYVIAYLRFQMRHTGLLRIDHVMGLHRLWWVPRGLPASDGAYVRYRAEELYAILSVESHLHKTMLAGENLGTVPPEVNQSMDRHGLRRMYVLQYEQQPEGPLPQPDADVVASVNTHDMPAFAAHWSGADIADRHSLGLIPDQNLAGEKRARARLRKNLIRFLRKERLITAARPSREQVFRGILRFLAQSPAETVLVNLEDLWGEELPQNVPGTSAERPNWQRKARFTIEAIKSDRRFAEMLELLKSER